MRLRDNTCGETVSEPIAFGRAQLHKFPAGRRMSLLASVVPWAIAAVAVIALMNVVYRGDARQASEPSHELPRRDTLSTEIADRLASQQEVINRLATQVEVISAQIAGSSPQPGTSMIARSPRRADEKHSDSAAASVAGAAGDLDKLRQYAKEVADSIARIDVQVSDPAVLQRKLDHQKVEIRSQPQ